MITDLITENDIKNNTAVAQNVDASFLLPYISVAQDSWILPFLGEAFYLVLTTEFIADGLSEDNLILVNKLKDCLTWFAYYEALPFIHYKTTNKGVMSKSSTNSDPVDLDTLNYMRENIKEIALTKRNTVLDFLNANEDKYPLFKKDICERNQGSADYGIVFY